MKKNIILFALAAFILASCVKDVRPSQEDINHTRKAIETVIGLFPDGWEAGELSERQTIESEDPSPFKQDIYSKYRYWQYFAHAVVVNEDGKSVVVEAHHHDQMRSPLRGVDPGTGYKVIIRFTDDNPSNLKAYNLLMRELDTIIPNTTLHLSDIFHTYSLTYATPYPPRQRISPDSLGIDPNDAPDGIEIDTVVF